MSIPPSTLSDHKAQTHKRIVVNNDQPNTDMCSNLFHVNQSIVHNNDMNFK